MSQSVNGGPVNAAQRITRRSHLRAAVGLGAGAVASVGCGATGQPAAPANAGPVTITYMANPAETNPGAGAALAQLDEFNRTNQLSITVNTADGKAATSQEKMLTLGAAGTPPDLYYAAYNSVASLAAAGMAIDVDAELKGDRDWTRQRADIFPSMVESQLWSGKLAAIPLTTNNQGIVYNVGLLQRDGVAPPKQNWNWNDFRAMAERFVRPETIPLSMAWEDWDHWLGTTGSRPIAKDARKITIDTPEMLATMEYLLGLYGRGIAQLTADGKSVAEQYRLAKNDTVFEVQVGGRFPTYRQVNAPPFAVTHIPIRPERGQLFGFAGGFSATIANVAPEKRRAAAQVAKWLNAPRQQAVLCQRGSVIPVSKGAMNDKDYLEYLKTDLPMKALVDIAPYGWRWPALPSFAKINGAIDMHVGAILRREASISGGLANAQREAQLALEDDIRLMK